MEQKTGLSSKVLLYKDFLEGCNSSMHKTAKNLLATNQGFQRLITSVTFMLYRLTRFSVPMLLAPLLSSNIPYNHLCSNKELKT